MAGKVYLIGAGPGDPKLLTVKGLECLKQADVLIYDRLANPMYLKEVRPTCELIYVGKASSDHTLSQADINELILQKARDGKQVVRLKGGDPYVFGRGGEEGEMLARHDVAFEVVPGISSAIGGLAYAGIPITHRDHASSFHVVTAHLKDDTGPDWDVLAKLEGTLVFLMGAQRSKLISQALIQAGKSKTTPVAFITHATTPKQQVTVTTLDDMAGIEVKPPTLIVVGTVVTLRDTLNFFEQKPLFGKSIVVTRASKQNRTLIEKITDRGGQVIEAPTIEVIPVADQRELEQEMKQLGNYQYVIFTSMNTVDIFFQNLDEWGYDARALAGVKVVAIGKQTAAGLKEKGVKADFIPTLATQEGLVELLNPLLTSTDRILLPKAKKTRPLLTDQLKAHVTEVILYELRLDISGKEQLINCLTEQTVDYMTFSSARTVEHLIETVGVGKRHLLKPVKLVSIGPITTKALEQAGLTVYKEAKEPLIDAMIEVLEEN
ncbi:MAG: uroporphyrinogen-III C-methyltransferase [Defluviitaleaceae bacterium]|nr:uroporphyrinogen-III C-methyltransferase [Defluviitaleaceae bacterium]